MDDILGESLPHKNLVLPISRLVRGIERKRKPNECISKLFLDVVITSDITQEECVARRTLTT